jgi:transcriptional regulator of heat shock response
MGGAKTAAEITERAGHVLAEVSNGLGIIVSPPLGKTVLEHARMWLLPDGRVVVVLISPGGNTRDKILRPVRPFAQAERDAIILAGLSRPFAAIFCRSSPPTGSSMKG